MENLRKKPLPRGSMFPESDDEKQQRSSLAAALESLMDERVESFFCDFFLFDDFHLFAPAD